MSGLLVLATSMAANASTRVVDKTDDDGSKHTLRGAILENNAEGGGNRIQINPTGNPHDEWVIRVNSPAAQHHRARRYRGQEPRQPNYAGGRR